MSGRVSSALALCVMFASACQSTPAPVPAVLSHAYPGEMERIEATLAKMMGRSHVELGPGDLTQSSVLSVLPLPPGPLDDRSLGMPAIFRLEIEGATCVLVREDTGDRVTLEGVECRAAAL